MTSLIPTTLINEIGTTMVFGLGYYLFKSISNKLNKTKQKVTNDNSDDEDDWFNDNKQIDPATMKLKSLKSKMEGVLSRWSYAKTLDDYHTIIKNDYKDIEDPFSILLQMSKKGIQPTIDTYNYLLYSNYVTNNEKADELLEQILDSTTPITANTYTLNIVIKGLCMKYKNEHNRFDEELQKMIKIFEDINVSLDITTENSILESYKEMNRIEDMWNHYITMKRKFSPDFETYSLLIKGIVKISNIDQEWMNKLFDIIEENKMINIVDKEVFDFIIQNCVKLNMIDKMKEINDEYASQITFDEKTYALLIKGYSKIYQFDKALKCFNKINNKSIDAYISIIQCAIRCQNYSKAEEIYNTIEESKRTCELYNLIVSLNKSKGSYYKAIEDIFEKEIKTNKIKCPIDISLMNSLLDCACKSNNIQKLNEIYNHISKSSIQCDSTTYSIMLQAYATANMTQDLSTLYNMIKDKFTIDEVLYNKIIQCYISSDEKEKAKEVFNDMKKKQLDINSLIYNEMIKLYIQSKDSTKCFELFNECIQHDQKLSKETYIKLIQLQIESNYTDRAITLFRNMLINKIERDSFVYELIIEMCFKNEMVKEACEFSVKALEENISVDKEIYINLPELMMIQSDLKYYERIEIASKIVDLMNRDSSEYKYSYKIIDGFTNIINGYNPHPAKRQTQRKKRNSNNKEESSLYDVVAKSEVKPKKKKKSKKNEEESIYDSNNTKQGRKRRNESYGEEVSIYA